MPHGPAHAASASRRRFLLALAAAGAAAALPPQVWAQACGTPWREWRAFVDRHIEPDGRVVDHLNKDLRSTSESQSYGLFFALVDNDPVLFDRILAWTRRHLCRGRADLNLPAWLWGRAADGQFRVLDHNTASDGELWIAYALLEAGRLWKRPGLVEAGRQTLALMRRAEVIDLPGFGPMLLPGNHGFVQADRWTLNPSYLPLFVLRRFAAVDARGPWARLAERSVAMTVASAPVGFAPDWIAWNGKDFVVHPGKGANGSYDAIRCYLWAGMTAANDPGQKPLLAALHGPLDALRAGRPMPEKVDTLSGQEHGAGNYGFNAALLPYLQAQGETDRAKALAASLPTPEQQRAAPPNYYAQVLSLFAVGWLEGRYRFAADGQLRPAWA